MKAVIAALFLAVFASEAVAKVYFDEPFHAGWEKDWIFSKYYGSKQGKFKWAHGKYAIDKTESKGAKTSTDERHYTMAKILDEPFFNGGRDLILQYTVRYTQRMDCAGSYIKLLPPMDEDELKQFNGETEYLLMFGPDECGYSEKKTHAIFSKHGEQFHNSKSKEHGLKPPSDELTHLYTLIIRADDTYEIRHDNRRKEGGSLSDHYDFQAPPEYIRDPKARRPADWVTEKKIVDPEDQQPEDWPTKEIPDPDDVKPADWDDARDGTWKPAMMPNPDYRGKWKPRKISNPDYRGEWEPPLIPNPAYTEDDIPEHELDGAIGAVGFEIWQIKSGVIFDNILLTDDMDEAEAHASKVMEQIDAEKAKDKESKEKEREDREEKRKNDIAERKKKALENGEEWDEDLDRVIRDDDMFEDLEFERRRRRKERERERETRGDRRSRKKSKSKKSKEELRKELEEQLKALEEEDDVGAEAEE